MTTTNKSSAEELSGQEETDREYIGAQPMVYQLLEATMVASETFARGEDFDLWESQVRQYIRHLPRGAQCDKMAISSLIHREQYVKLTDCGIPRESIMG